jgi:hypothetical protein
MNVEQYTRRPVHVGAVKVTAENFFEVAEWCGGQIKPVAVQVPAKASNAYILLDIPKAASQRQKEAYVGDWVIKLSTGGFQVYTAGAFHKHFVIRAERPARPNKKRESTTKVG